MGSSVGVGPMPRTVFIQVARLVVLTLSGCFELHPQTLSVSPNPAVIRTVHRGPVTAHESLNITSPGSATGNWTARVSENSPWIVLSSTKGTTPAKITVGLV